MLQTMPGSQTAKPGKGNRGSRSSSSFDSAITDGASKPAFDPQTLIDAQSNLSDATAAQTPEAAAQVDWLAQQIYGDKVDVGAPEETTDIAQAQSTVDQALRDQRAAALGVKPDRTKPVNIKRKVDRMSQEEYDALTPLQRAAVDFNTNLVGAVRKDRKLEDVYDPTKDQQAAYKVAIDNMFPGPGGGSKQYAPETMAVLQQIDFTDTAGDLDDFLNLDAAVKAKDLKRLEPQDVPSSAPTRGMGGGPGGEGNTYANPLTGERVGLSERLAQGTQAAQAALEKGNKMLANYGTTVMAEDRERTVSLLGGAPTREATIIGYGNGELDTYFQQAFDMLANSASDPNTMFQILQNERTLPERKAFMKYAESRILAATQSGDPLGTTDGTAYRNPVEVAQLLGLPGLKKTKAPQPAEPAAPSSGGGNAYSYGP